MNLRAHYADGSVYDGPYGGIRRDEVVAVEVAGHRFAVPPGTRLVWRERHAIGGNTFSFGLLSFETDERKGEVHIIRPDGAVMTLPGYGSGAVDAPPQLLEFE